MIQTAAELEASARRDPEPPDGLSPELRALWFTKAARWEVAHNVAQDIDSKMGSWIHAHLHVIEGDLWNAGYWYRKAGQPETKPQELEAEWVKLAEANLDARSVE
ncbi:hypothetical protein BH23VER1_BH23VER1_24530 [soil metagenome]